MNVAAQAMPCSRAVAVTHPSRSHTMPVMGLPKRRVVGGAARRAAGTGANAAVPIAVHTNTRAKRRAIVGVERPCESPGRA